MQIKRIGSLCAGVVCMASVCSCVVDDSYDLKKFNKEMTVVPGLSVPIPENVETNSKLQASDLISLGSSFSTSNGAYETRSEGTVSKTVSEYELSTGVRMDDIVIKFSGIPNGIDLEATNLVFEKVPVKLALINPTGYPVKVDAIIKAGKKSKVVSWTLSESTELQVKDDIDISDIISSIPETVSVTDITLSSMSTKSSVIEADDVNNFKFDLNAISSIPLKFRPKSVLVFTTALKDITTDLSSLNFDATKAVVKLIVNSTIPLSIEGSAKASGASMSMSRLKANAINQEVTISLEAESGVTDLSDMLITVKAENDTDKLAVIDENCKLDITLKEVTLPDGVTVK